jgi:hypothetical protein
MYEGIDPLNVNISILERMNDLVILFINNVVDVKAKVQIATSTSSQVDGLMNRTQVI